MAISKTDVSTIVKQLLCMQEEDRHDDLIDLYINSMEQHILNDIKHRTMPDGLMHTWAHMTAGALTAEQSAVLHPPDPEGETFEVQIGDTSVKPVKPVASPTGPKVTVVQSLLFDYRIDLNRYRRMGW